MPEKTPAQPAAVAEQTDPRNNDARRAKLFIIAIQDILVRVVMTSMRILGLYFSLEYENGNHGSRQCSRHQQIFADPCHPVRISVSVMNINSMSLMTYVTAAAGWEATPRSHYYLLDNGRK